jgi:hypothetical protein
MKYAGKGSIAPLFEGISTSEIREAVALEKYRKA